VGLSTAKMSARTTARLPGSGLGNARMEDPRIVGFDAPAWKLPLDPTSPPRRDWRGLLWIALIMFAITAAAIQAIK
jgi:hypothetical protein